MTDFTDLEKLKTVELLIQLWRAGRSSLIDIDAEIERPRLTLILKEIADEIRARDPKRATETIIMMQREIDNARLARDRSAGGGYPYGNLRAVAELTIGRWPSIREALERFGKEERR